MDTIHFQAEVGEDRTIRVPEGIDVPPGPARITVTPKVPEQPATDADDDFPSPKNYSKVGDWLAAVGRYAETLDTELPSDMAENHDYYAHGKPRE
jgi:hypothetical protein